MKRTLRNPIVTESEQMTEGMAKKAWIALGSLLALGVAVMVARELPSMRREWRLMRM